MDLILPSLKALAADFANGDQGAIEEGLRRRDRLVCVDANLVGLGLDDNRHDDDDGTRQSNDGGTWEVCL